MDGGAWKAPWGREGSDTTERLHFHVSLSCIGEGNGNPLQCSCLKNPRDGEAWWAAVYGVTQSWTWLNWLSSSSSIFPLGFPGGWDGIPRLRRSPGEGNTHSSILAQRISWTEEPGRLQSMGSQRVKHYWVGNTLEGFIYIYKHNLELHQTQEKHLL